MTQPAPPEPAPPEPGRTKAKPARRKDREKDFDQRLDDWGQRLGDSIQERVVRMLDRSLGKLGPVPTSEADDEAIDDIAERAASFEEKIRARVEASLRAAGVPPEPPSS